MVDSLFPFFAASTRFSLAVVDLCLLADCNS
jgi:hypothetical protein